METIQSFTEVLSEEKIKELYIKCNCDINDDDYSNRISCKHFVNEYALIHYGLDWESGTPYTNIIDKNGDFVEIQLDNDIKYSGGMIKHYDKGEIRDCPFYISRIVEKQYDYIPMANSYYFMAEKETAFFYIEVQTFEGKSSEYTDRCYVINPDLEVIANFSSSHKFGVMCHGQRCEVFTQSEFYFIDENREYLIFSQRGVADNGCINIWSSFEEDRETDRYFSMDDCSSFFDPFDPLDIFSDLEAESEKWGDAGISDDPCWLKFYGIIDCHFKSAKQLLPFTDCLDIVYRIIKGREQQQRELRGRFPCGWINDGKHFCGDVLSQEYLEYPPRFFGLSLEYLHQFYPDRLMKLSKNGLILIPNCLLDTLENDECIKFIRMNQEKHLSYTAIRDIQETLNGSEYKGVVSSYQGKTIKQIVQSKGGRDYLVELMNYGHLDIHITVLEELSSNSESMTETNAYKKLLSIKNRIDIEKEAYQEYLEDLEREARHEWEEEMNRQANDDFNDMMDDYDAWGNID